jgi:F0F1-type ATP synthase membrane subunit b/b'
MLIISLIALQVIIFIVLIHVFRTIMTQNVSKATSHLETLNKEYVRKEEEAQAHLSQAQQQADALLVKAQEDAARVQAEALKHVEEESQVVLNQARTQAQDIIQQAERSKEQLLAEINERIERRAAVKAGELLAECLPEEFTKDIHIRWVDDLLDKGFGQLDRLHIPGDLDQIHVSSAFAFTSAQKNLLSRKLETALGRSVRVDFEENCHLVAGFVIRAGSVVLDGTLVNKIKEKIHNGSEHVERA